MDRVISLKAAIDALGRIGSLDTYADREYATEIFMNLPSAQQWVPCSERLPEHDGEKYLVTLYSDRINVVSVRISYCYMNRDGFWSDVPVGYKVTAWMPLPEPYKGE